MRFLRGKGIKSVAFSNMISRLDESVSTVYKSAYANSNQRTACELMEIAFHIGANCTDEDRLLKSLLKNVGTFAHAGSLVPGPGKYRRILRETIQSLDGSPPAEHTRAYLLDAIIDGDPPDRLVLSNSNFICVPNRIFNKGAFYEQTESKLRGLKSLFPDDDFEIFLGLRNPATFLPEVLRKSKADTLDTYLKGFHPSHIRWSDVVRRIRHTLPDALITVWCNEDTPFIWAELIRNLAGVADNHPINGGFDLLACIMSPEGMNRLIGYLREHPPTSEVRKRRIIAAFLNKYAIEDEIEETVDVAGLDEQMVDDLTEIYDQDVDMIAQMSDVNFIEP